MGMSRSLLNIEKRSLLRLKLSGDGLASKYAVSVCFGDLPELHAALEAAYEPSIVGSPWRFLQGSCSPAHRHRGGAPPLHVAANAPRAHRILDDVGAGERAAQLLRQAKPRDGE